MSAGLVALVNAVLPGFLTVCVFRLVTPRSEGTGTILVATALAWNVVIDALVRMPVETGIWTPPAWAKDWLEIPVAIVLGFVAAKIWSNAGIHRWLRQSRITTVGPHDRIAATMFEYARNEAWASVIYVKQDEKPIYGEIHSWSVHGQVGEIAVRTRRRDDAPPDKRYQDTRTVEDVFLSLDNVTKIEFVNPNLTAEEAV